jgi:hypothetical protein
VIDVQMPGLSGNAAVFKMRANGYRGRVLTLRPRPRRTRAPPRSRPAPTRS